MILCILGRQPEIGFTELEALYPGKVKGFGKNIALVDVDKIDVQNLGGVQKTAQIIHEFPHADWSVVSSFILKKYTERACDKNLPKLTIGFSAYDPSITLAQIHKLSIRLKSNVKHKNGSLRSIPNTSRELNTATSHHNKLGLSENKKEVIIARYGQRTIIAESTGAQNITALARRDQGRPKRDAFVGMLPPKLALSMYNIGVGTHLQISSQNNLPNPTILDPFCGTGVVLQEAYLRGANVYGSDLSERMVSYSAQNLDWLAKTHPRANGTVKAIEYGDATEKSWLYAQNLNAIICETYLGQPFSNTPSPEKLRQVRDNCDHIISSFLVNIRKQISDQTSLCIAVPAWRNLQNGTITRLPLTRDLARLGFNIYNQKPLLYYRENQVVARDILILSKKA